MILSGLPFLLAATMLNLAPIFTDHAVIQRGDSTPVWGTAEPGAPVRVTLGEHVAETRADDEGQWRTILSGLQPGGPFEMQVRAGDTEITLNDVLVGDVWLCSGQSNMQWPMSDVTDGIAEARRTASLENVRLFLLPKMGAEQPADSVEAAWSQNGEQATAAFSAVAQYFAMELRASPELAGVPIGLIDSSYGGTCIEAWISEETLARDHESDDLRESFFGWKTSSMYNGMIHPLIPCALKGVLWYQGESNSGRPELYRRLLCTLISEWRSDFRSESLPFLIVQLPNQATRFDQGFFTWIREAQHQVSKDVPDVWMAVSIDTGDGFDVHPKHKTEVGRRLGLLARHHVYNEELVSEGPRLSSSTRKGGTLVLEFAAETGPLRGNQGESLTAFKIAGNDGRYFEAGAVLQGGRIIVNSDSVPEPVHVRYAWEGNPVPSLFNRAGLSASPFRTDSLPLDEREIHRMPEPWRIDSITWTLDLSGEGHVTSLRAGTSEFLSNCDPMMPGAHLNWVWGPAHLFDVRRLSDRTLRASLDMGSLQIEVTDEGMIWTIENRRGEEMEFRIAVSEEASAMEEHGGGRITLRAGVNTLDLEPDGEWILDDWQARRLLRLPLKEKGTRRIVVRPSAAQQ